MKSTLKLITFLIFASFLFFNCKSVSRDLKCKDFENGTFEFQDEILDKKYVIIRKNENQIEQVYDLKTNKMESEAGRVMKISWVNNCEYSAMLDTIKSTKYDGLDLQMITAGGLNNKIIKIEKNCATTETSIGNFKKNFVICKKPE